MDQGGDAVTIRMRKTIEDLTPREMDVLRLMAQGLGNRDIAERLDVNERTIKSHVSTILSKFGVTNRTEAVTYALHRGLITL
jgi:DNA-binding NarL/FixJ family response regulator